MERKIVFAPGEFYHIYNRGVDKRVIFTNDADRRRFIRLMYLSNGDIAFKYRDVEKLPFEEIKTGEKSVAIGAYCLMGNHFHILIKEIKDGGISSFMGKLQTGYSMYFNRMHKRTGTLFEGTFKAKHVEDDDEYLKYLYAYIHLNPVKLSSAGWESEVKHIENPKAASEFLEKYPWSSYLDYCGLNREENLILSKAEFPGYFDEKGSFDDMHHDWISYEETPEEDQTHRGLPYANFA